MSDELTSAQQAIRDKLNKMKKMFDEEEEIEKAEAKLHVGIPRPESSEWDLHRHKIAYHETVKKRERYIKLEEQKKKTGGVRGESPLIAG